jgi:hypothetical protein
VDVDLVDGAGPLLPGGELCSVFFVHEGIDGDRVVEAGRVELGGSPLAVDGGDVVLELGEADSASIEATSGLYSEIQPDGLLDPIERSQGALIYGSEREDVEAAPADALVQVGATGARVLRTNAPFPDYDATEDASVDFAGIAFGDGVWMAVGSRADEGVAAVSEDGGLTWTTMSLATELNDVTFFDGHFVATSPAGTLERYGDNGWETLSAPPKDYVGLASSDIGLIAVAGHSVVFSKDAETWDTVILPDTAGAGAFAGGASDEAFVVVGDFGYRARSLDGLTWTDQDQAGEPLRGVTWNGTEWLAVGDRDTWFSSDAQTWISVSDQALVDVASHLGSFIAVDEEGALFELDPTEVWQTYLPSSSGGAFHALASSRP